ncbi:MAG: amidohydrolase family protein [Gammaproteobacteria bacterium]|nr:amidohydrolase family protein [Gammaproteobacteria bacterium]
MSQDLADLRIDARWIAPMRGREAPLEGHSLLVRDGRILALLPRNEAIRRFRATTVIARPAHLLLPGLVDAHVHAPLAALRGLLAENTDAAWSGRAPYAADAAIGAAGARFAAGTMPFALLELLSAGVTCFLDQHWFAPSAARAAVESGMRAVIAAPVAEHETPAARTIDEHLAAALALHDEYRDHPTISTAFAPAALALAGDESLVRLKTIADELDSTITLHVQEGAAAVAESLARHGRRPLERLHALGLLTPALHAVHLNGLEASELELAARTGIAATICPGSNLRLGQGLPGAARLAAHGLRLGIGSDGGAANNALDPWQEIRLVALSTRHSPDAALDAFDVIAMATRGGAAALGLERQIGTLEPGKWADLCCLDAQSFDDAPPSLLFDWLAFRGGRDIVSDVWVAGRPLLADSQPTRLDPDEARAQARHWAALVRNGGG